MCSVLGEEKGSREWDRIRYGAWGHVTAQPATNHTYFLVMTTSPEPFTHRMRFLPPDRPGLRGTDEIAKLNEAVGRSLCLELDKTHRYPLKGDVTVYTFLIAKMPALR